MPQKVSEAQFMRAATKMKLVDGEAAEAYLGRGLIPDFIAAPVNKLPEAERIDARLKIVGATEFFRSDALFDLLIASGVATSEQVDDLFRLAETLN